MSRRCVTGPLPGSPRQRVWHARHAEPRSAVGGTLVVSLVPRASGGTPSEAQGCAAKSRSSERDDALLPPTGKSRS